RERTAAVDDHAQVRVRSVDARADSRAQGATGGASVAGDGQGRRPVDVDQLGAGVDRVDRVVRVLRVHRQIAEDLLPARHPLAVLVHELCDRQVEEAGRIDGVVVDVDLQAVAPGPGAGCGHVEDVHSGPGRVRVAHGDLGGEGALSDSHHVGLAAAVLE